MHGSLHVPLRDIVALSDLPEQKIPNTNDVVSSFFRMPLLRAWMGCRKAAMLRTHSLVTRTLYAQRNLESGFAPKRFVQDQISTEANLPKPPLIDPAQSTEAPSECSKIEVSTGVHDPESAEHTLATSSTDSMHGVHASAPASTTVPRPTPLQAGGAFGAPLQGGVAPVNPHQQTGAPGSHIAVNSSRKISHSATNGSNSGGGDAFVPLGETFQKKFLPVPQSDLLEAAFPTHSGKFSHVRRSNPPPPLHPPSGFTLDCPQSCTLWLISPSYVLRFGALAGL